ncbi:hypothetical protein [Actinacidiphila acidipaludis]|uniref:Uncharacterized protein n=1 Tax=Actinacidiphila acidipaludis TaxID=2873382 RepID=A0ABS7QHD3_9ACTN|nr:hypothetical protein [Streptomyces acidipaludis]MBY8882568.1 hypothetical protein [Streptomyces acidipaludis]
MARSIVAGAAGRGPGAEMAHGRVDGGAVRRFGPGWVWLAVMVADLAVSCVVVHACWAALLSHAEEGGPRVAPSGSLTWFAVLLTVSVGATWYAALRRRTHPQSVRAAFAVSLIRLILLSLAVGLPYAVERGCGC